VYSNYKTIPQVYQTNPYTKATVLQRQLDLKYKFNVTRIILSRNRVLIKYPKMQH